MPPNNKKISPYLSIVTASRNDNYGGRLEERMTNFIESISFLASRYSLPVELIIVDWNPPSNKKKLSEIFSSAYAHEFCTMRFIEVPESLHATITTSHMTPFYESHGKNVGIRRAFGEYVLTTNNDLIFSEKLFTEFARRTLSQDSFYRVNRYEVQVPIDPHGTFEDKQKQCRENWFFVAHVNHTVYRFPQVSAFRYIRWILSSIKKSALSPFYTNFLTTTGIHFAVAGDFMLMSKENWMKFRGFHEFPAMGLQDALMCSMAASTGLKQIIFDGEIFHQEHNRSEKDGRPGADNGVLEWRTREMLATCTPWITNDLSWGFKDVELPETIFS